MPANAAVASDLVLKSHGSTFHEQEINLFGKQKRRLTCTPASSGTLCLITEYFIVNVLASQHAGGSENTSNRTK